MKNDKRDFKALIQTKNSEYSASILKAFEQLDIRVKVETAADENEHIIYVHVDDFDIAEKFWFVEIGPEKTFVADASVAAVRVANPLKAIGFWRADNDQNSFIHPEKLVGKYESSDKAKLLSYLDSGVVCAGCLGFSYCRFRCGVDDTVMGSKDLTDGVWVWPEGLSHYVQAHDVVLMGAFLQYAGGMEWKVPAKIHFGFDQTRISYDFDLWEKYCRYFDRKA